MHVILFKKGDNMNIATWTLVGFTIILALAAVIGPFVSWHYKKKELFILKLIENNKLMINQNFGFALNGKLRALNQSNVDYNIRMIDKNFKLINYILQQKDISDKTLKKYEDSKK